MNNFDMFPLFAVPLYRENIGHDFSEIVKNLNYERMPSENGSYSSDKMILESNVFFDLKSSIANSVHQFVYECLSIKKNFDFQIENSWINLHYPGDYAGSHRHSNSLISGIYYIDVNENSGPIIFEKDKSFYNLFTDTLEIEFNDENLNIFNLEAWSFVPKKGDLFLFPSLLYHHTGINNSESNRYSLAFNVFPRGIFGKSINSLIIKK
jgi:uncharacterized protein (TIGR02466 family)